MNEIRLYNTYYTDLKKMGYTYSLNSQPIGESLTRSYYDGTITKGDVSVRAKLINFVTGNMQVLSVSGDTADEIVSDLNAYFNKHFFKIGLRTFFRYLYLLMTPILASICFYFWVHLQWGAFFKGFILMNVLRFFYAESRNYL